MNSQPNLERLLLRGSSWYVFYGQLRAWMINEDEKLVRPYAFVILDQNSHAFLDGDLFNHKPTAEDALEFIVDTMVGSKTARSAAAGRPNKIDFEQDELAAALSKQLAEMGIASQFAPNRLLSSELLNAYSQDIRESEYEIEGMSSEKGVTPAVLREFYQAAAEFFRAEPWIYLADENVLVVTIPAYGTKYVSIMGISGVEYGMTVIEQRDQLEAMLFSEPEEDIDISEGLHGITFEEKYEIPFDDLDEIERFRYEIAAENAYPYPMVYFGGGARKRPSKNRLLWYQAVMRAIVQFVDLYFRSGEQTDKKNFEFQVRVGKDQLKVQIEYPLEDFIYQDEMAPVDFISRDELVNLNEAVYLDLDLLAAQKLIGTAAKKNNPKKRVQLAEKALAKSKDCADAYLILANDRAKSNQEKLEFFEAAVEAGKKIFDEYYFEDHAGYFWELLDVRPYMRASFSRASCLWVLGRKDEAVKGFWRLLALNTNDNQGVRYRLLPALLALERYSDAAELTEAYDTKREAVWLFTRALLKFREIGGVSASTRALKKAMKQNPYVQAYLTGEKRIPEDLPRQYALGDEDEAIFYAEQHLNFWRKTPGAIGWLMAVVKAMQEE